MKQPEKSVGQSWNVCGDPIGLKDYARGVCSINEWKKPEIRERKWLDFSYAIDKLSLNADLATWLVVTVIVPVSVPVSVSVSVSVLVSVFAAAGDILFDILSDSFHVSVSVSVPVSVSV